jgi:CubicO group peptidase (beta-lactamase class C family)
MQRIVFVVTLAVCTLRAAEPAKVDVRSSGLDAARLAAIPQRMKQFVDRGHAVGIVTLVQRHGALGSLEAVGWQDKEKGVAMATKSIFEVMSMTKPVTAVGIQILAEEGLLALSDPVEKYLPEFRGQMMVESREQDRVILRKPPRPVTIRDLLTHTSGLPEMPPEGLGGVRFYYDMNRTLAEAVVFFSQMPLEFTPGSKWSYSNPGIATLGRIIEVVSGQPYETFLTRRVFEPLGMKDSFFFPPEDKKARIAAVYEKRDGKLQSMGERIYRKGAKYPMPEGGLYSTAQDMAAFYQMMLNGGSYQGKRILTRFSTQVMTMLHSEGTGANWGLGWQVARGASSTLNLSSEGAYGHGGAFGTYGWVDPAKDLVGVFMVQNFGFPDGGARAVFIGMANAAVLEEVKK